jgi:5-(carboxyamino)imidazole ribonucleotide synthase
MRVGIIGTGQLARMMAEAGKDLSVDIAFLRVDNDDTQSVEGFGPISMVADYHTAEDIYAALGKPDVITVDKESVDLELMKSLQTHCPVYPEPDTVRLTQHRLLEKTWLNEQGIGTAAFRPCSDYQSLVDGVAELGYPVIVKSCEAGYDGKNQWRLNNPQDLDKHWPEISQVEAIIEQMVNFKCEVSLIGARNTEGETSCYPLAENDHAHGVLLSSRVPTSELPDWVEEKAQQYMQTLLSASNYVGVLTIECFVTDQELLVNELAPRVHNSGHWTLLGSETSQFENHIRAITGKPLGSKALKAPTAMVNLLGVDPKQVELTDADCQLYDYGKGLKPGRKMGHINYCSQDLAKLEQWLQQQIEQVYGQD